MLQTCLCPGCLIAEKVRHLAVNKSQESMDVLSNWHHIEKVLPGFRICNALNIARHVCIDDKVSYTRQKGNESSMYIFCST